MNATLGRSYCGRKDVQQSKSWLHVTCQDCKAARAADEAARS